MRVETVALDKLNPAKYNPRTMTPKAMARLERSLKEFGLVDPLIVNVRTGYTVVGGHQRLTILQKQGAKEVECVLVDLEPEREKALNVALNNPEAQGEFDRDLLTSLLDDVKGAGVDVAEMGLDDEALEKLIGVPKPEPKEDDPPKPPIEAISACGDLWSMDAHRILCGDAAIESDWQTLIEDTQFHMLLTDPPYGVDYEGGSGTTVKREKLEGDHSADLYRVFLPHALKRATPKATVYLWFAGRHGLAVYDAVAAARLSVRALIVWNKLKPHYGAFMANYLQRHEPCLYCVQKDGADWHGPTNEVTVWDIEQPRRNDLHPTQKPVECMARPIQNSTARSAIIADPFLGSGTTLVAAEQTGRRCYGMEIEPRYVDVAVRRWQNLTGKKAKNLTRPEVTLD